tara:strand:+ start:656 stop:2296 length:1641 start_codon:yes stop_codon:yes gene_type:complete
MASETSSTRKLYKGFEEPVDPDTGSEMDDKQRSSWRSAIDSRILDVDFKIPDAPTATSMKAIGSPAMEIPTTVGEPEYAKPEEGATGEDVVRSGLDVAGPLPGVGEVADIATMGLDIKKGDYPAAAISGAAALLPFVSARMLKVIRAAGTDAAKKASKQLDDLEKGLESGSLSKEEAQKRATEVTNDFNKSTVADEVLDERRWHSRHGGEPSGTSELSPTYTKDATLVKQIRQGEFGGDAKTLLSDYGQVGYELEQEFLKSGGKVTDHVVELQEYRSWLGKELNTAITGSTALLSADMVEQVAKGTLKSSSIAADVVSDPLEKKLLAQLDDTPNMSTRAHMKEYGHDTRIPIAEYQKKFDFSDLSDEQIEAMRERNMLLHSGKPGSGFDERIPAYSDVVPTEMRKSLSKEQWELVQAEVGDSRHRLNALKYALREEGAKRSKQTWIRGNEEFKKGIAERQQRSAERKATRLGSAPAPRSSELEGLLKGMGQGEVTMTPTGFIDDSGQEFIGTREITGDWPLNFNTKSIDLKDGTSFLIKEIIPPKP